MTSIVPDRLVIQLQEVTKAYQGVNSKSRTDGNRIYLNSVMLADVDHCREWLSEFGDFSLEARRVARGGFNQAVLWGSGGSLEHANRILESVQRVAQERGFSLVDPGHAYHRNGSGGAFESDMSGGDFFELTIRW